jgi:type I restriction enzyme S subunit
MYALAATDISGYLTGSTMPKLTQGNMNRIPVVAPPLKQQQAIACILGALDDKIELNRRMNRTLEDIARAIFTSWFVDFDPVRAKCRGGPPCPPPKGQAQRPAPTQWPQHILDLFPDRLVDSELGEIPKGWSVRPLPEIMHINPTRSIPRGTLAPYLDMANMPTQGPSPDTCVMREMGSGMKFRNGDTLVARITPCLENGKTAFVDFLADGEVGWGSTEYIVLRPKGTIPPLFAYLLARTDEFRMFAIQQMTGSSGRQRVPAASLEKYRIVTPDIDSPLYLNFGNIVSPMFDRIRASMLQSRTLAAFRDALLPKLLSGKLGVPDAERIAARCV